MAVRVAPSAPLRQRLVQGTPPSEDRERLRCPACGFIAYVNPRLVVTTIPVTDAGEVVLLRRGIEPGVRRWAQPGGFLEVDETVHEAAIRETLEETGLLVDPGEIVGLYSRLEAAVVVVLLRRGSWVAQPHDARGAGGPARSHPTPSPGTDRASTTTFWALRDWVRVRHPEVVLPEVVGLR